MKIFLLILTISVLIINIENRKKKKKVKEPKKPESPLDRRPSSVKPELYCDSCIAMIKESIKELRGKKREIDVVDVVDDVCNPEKYYSYHHPPPEMKEGCEAFLAGWEEDIVQVLVNRIDTDSAVRQLCYDISQACQNVDPGNVKPFDDTIMIDGQPTKINQEKKEDI